MLSEWLLEAVAAGSWAEQEAPRLLGRAEWGCRLGCGAYRVPSHQLSGTGGSKTPFQHVSSSTGHGKKEAQLAPWGFHFLILSIPILHTQRPISQALHVNVTPSAKLQGCLCNRTLHFQKVVDWCYSFPMAGLGYFFPCNRLWILYIDSKFFSKLCPHNPSEVKADRINLFSHEGEGKREELSNLKWRIQEKT